MTNLLNSKLWSQDGNILICCIVNFVAILGFHVSRPRDSRKYLLSIIPVQYTHYKHIIERKRALCKQYDTPKSGIPSVDTVKL